MQNLTLQIFFKLIRFLALTHQPWKCDQKFYQMCPPPRLSQHYLQTISRVSPEYLQNNDYQNSNIKKVVGRILKQIFWGNILAQSTGAENPSYH